MRPDVLALPVLEVVSDVLDASRVIEAEPARHGDYCNS